MSDRDTYRDTLFYAVAIAGSERQLARRLRVSVVQLDRWLSGVAEIPERIFQAALDVVIDSSPQAIRRSRELLHSVAR
jgi:DNA-binding transcriptional regulator YdaS (Cro superfamily)